MFVALIVAALTLGTAGLMPARADTVSDNIFLQGSFLELGIRPNGTFGSTVPAPDGFHPNMPDGSLGFVVDHQKDGWLNGTPPFAGDFFMPGSPWEGFGVSCGAYDSEDANFENAENGDLYQFDIATDSLVENSINSATWIGHVDLCGTTLQITHDISFNSGDTYVTIETTIKNIGGETVDALTFGRGLDPDQENLWTGNYQTLNTVLYQPGENNFDTAIVEAKSLQFPDMRLWLGTVDVRARANAFNYSFGIDNLFALYNYDMGPIASDVAMQIAYDLGSLDPDDKTTMTYWYGFNEEDMYTVADHPTAVDDFYQTGVDDAFNSVDTDQDSVLDNDLGTYNSCAYLENGVSDGYLEFYSDGSFYYEPDPGFQGVDSFTYFFYNDDCYDDLQGANAEANGLSMSNYATVYITVNAAPVANPDWNFMMSYDTLSGNVLDNDTDDDGDTLEAWWLGGPDYADDFYFNGDGEYMYSPADDFSGIDAFWYWVTDGTEFSNTTFESFWVFPPIQESHITINYNGWQGYYDKNASNGTYRGNNEKGGAFTFAPNYKFKGFTLFTYRGPDQGKVRIFLDGKFVKTVDLYRATPQWGYAIPLTFLNGKHTLRFENLGIPAGKFLRMDYAKVNTNSGKLTLEDTDPAITWGVDLWKTYKDAEAMDGSYRKSTLNKARAIHDFYGDRIDWITMTGPNLGIAKVIIDGTVVDMVDLYSPDPVYQVIFTYDGLGYDHHRIRIEATGTHSGGSTGNAIVVDAFGSYTIFDSCDVLAKGDLTSCVPAMQSPRPAIRSREFAPQQ
jgi:hypothetical protein